MSWKDIRVGDYLTVLTDYHANGAYEKLKKNVTLKYEPDYAVMIRTLNFERGDFKDDLIYLNEEEYEFLAKSKVKPYDIVMNKIANAGSVYFMPNLNKPVSLAMNLFLLRFDERVDQKFMFYLMKVNEPYIKTFANGTTTKTITKDAVKNLNFKLPPLPVQQKIASILSAYDDLIENNQKRIALLEKSARLLYEEWFVRLRFPGYEHTNIENGIPEGWKSAKIKELGEVVTGKTPDTKNERFFGDEIPFIKTPDMHNNVFVIGTLTNLSIEGAESQAKKYIPENSLVISCIGTLGVVSIVGKTSQTNQQINAVIPNEESLIYFCYFSFKKLKEKLEGIGGGATMGNVNKTKFEGLGILTPTSTLLSEYHSISVNLFEQIKNLQYQIQKLKQARDLLLPKLINGEIPV